MSQERLEALGRSNPRLQRLRRIVRGEEPGLTVVDGVKLLRDLVAAGVKLQEVYVTEARLADLGPLLDRLRTGRMLHLLTEESAARLAPTRTGQGVLAVVRVPEHDIRPRGIGLYLDRIQDPGNVGGVIRCAAAFGARAVACSPGCADPFSARAIRASAGHSLLLPTARDAAFAPLANAFVAAGGEVAGAAGDGATELASWRPRPPLLLVVGNEGQGLDPDLLARCTSTVRIPLAAGVDSLNVAVAAGVILAALAGLAGSHILDSQHSSGGLDDPSS